MQRSRVDLPQPEAPMMTLMLPRGNSRVRSLKRVCAPNDFVNASILTTAGRWRS